MSQVQIYTDFIVLIFAVKLVWSCLFLGEIFLNYVFVIQKIQIEILLKGSKFNST